MATEANAEEIVQTAAESLRSRLVAAAQAEDSQRQAAVQIALDDCLATLAGTGIWGEANRVPSSILWNSAGELLETGWLQARARNKPRGYAGDAELLRRIAEREICDHPLGSCFDRYFQGQAAPQAVRNRIELAAEWIDQAATNDSSGECRVALVGSGPAQEVMLACARLQPEARSRLRLALLDVDGEAAQGAASRLARDLGQSQVSAVQGNLFRLAERPALASHLKDARLIICTGLFDYLTSPVAAAVLAAFWRQLAPGGAAYVFNFAPRNPTRAYMEWIGNWYLLYRTEEELAELAAGASIPRESWKIGAEPQGIDLYLAIQKPF